MDWDRIQKEISYHTSTLAASSSSSFASSTGFSRISDKENLQHPGAHPRQHASSSNQFNVREDFGFGNISTSPSSPTLSNQYYAGSKPFDVRDHNTDEMASQVSSLMREMNELKRVVAVQNKRLAQCEQESSAYREDMAAVGASVDHARDRAEAVESEARSAAKSVSLVLREKSELLLLTRTLQGRLHAVEEHLRSSDFQYATKDSFGQLLDSTVEQLQTLQFAAETARGKAAQSLQLVEGLVLGLLSGSQQQAHAPSGHSNRLDFLVNLTVDRQRDHLHRLVKESLAAMVDEAVGKHARDLRESMSASFQYVMDALLAKQIQGVETAQAKLAQSQQTLAGKLDRMVEHLAVIEASGKEMAGRITSLECDGQSMKDTLLFEAKSTRDTLVQLSAESKSQKETRLMQQHVLDTLVDSQRELKEDQNFVKEVQVKLKLEHDMLVSKTAQMLLDLKTAQERVADVDDNLQQLTTEAIARESQQAAAAEALSSLHGLETALQELRARQQSVTGQLQGQSQNVEELRRSSLGLAGQVSEAVLALERLSHRVEEVAGSVYGGLSRQAAGASSPMRDKDIVRVDKDASAAGSDGGQAHRVDRLEASLVSLTAAMDALQEELQSVSESNSKLADQVMEAQEDVLHIKEHGCGVATMCEMRLDVLAASVARLHAAVAELETATIKAKTQSIQSVTESTLSAETAPPSSSASTSTPSASSVIKSRPGAPSFKDLKQQAVAASLSGPSVAAIEAGSRATGNSGKSEQPIPGPPLSTVSSTTATESTAKSKIAPQTAAGRRQLQPEDPTEDSSTTASVTAVKPNLTVQIRRRDSDMESEGDFEAKHGDNDNDMDDDQEQDNNRPTATLNSVSTAAGWVVEPVESLDRAATAESPRKKLPASISVSSTPAGSPRKQPLSPGSPSRLSEASEEQADIRSPNADATTLHSKQSLSDSMGSTGSGRLRLRPSALTSVDTMDYSHSFDQSSDEDDEQESDDDAEDDDDDEEVTVDNEEDDEEDVIGADIPSADSLAASATSTTANVSPMKASDVLLQELDLQERMEQERVRAQVNASSRGLSYGHTASSASKGIGTITTAENPSAAVSSTPLQVNLSGSLLSRSSSLGRTVPAGEQLPPLVGTRNLSRPLYETLASSDSRLQATPSDSVPSSSSSTQATAGAAISSGTTKIGETMQCPHCLRRIAKADSGSHAKSCELRTEFCSFGCGAKIRYIKMSQHLEVCPNKGRQQSRADISDDSDAEI